MKKKDKRNKRAKNKAKNINILRSQQRYVNSPKRDKLEGK